MNPEFAAKNRCDWMDVVNALVGAVPFTSAQWTSLPDVTKVLRLIMLPDMNHTMIPPAGGFDIQGLGASAEAGCLEFYPEAGAAFIFRPGTLHLEYFPRSPWNSFFHLEIQPLDPSGVYEDTGSESEELVELGPGKYADRGPFETGSIGVDENGVDIPTPADARMVVRFFRGRFLIVAKASLLCQASGRYDMRVSSMTPQQLRAELQPAVDRLEPDEW